MSDVYQKKDLIGKRYGMLTVIEDSGKRNGHSILWYCKCDCGGGIFAIRSRLQSGIVTDCGCVPKPTSPHVTDLIGQRFGKLTVTGDSGNRKGRCILWTCRCDCGNEILLKRVDLTSGNVQSCGCVQRPHASKKQMEELTGKQFGELTVLRPAGKNKQGRVCWLCRCSCGKECTVPALQLKNGHTRSCGCKRHESAVNKKDITGKRFGRLVALYPVAKGTPPRKTFWHCRCDCGKELDVNTISLLHGRTQSCGCQNQEQSAKMHEHMHYQDNTCIETLKQIHNGQQKNKNGFRGLFLTKSGSYRANITFQGVHYHLGYFSDMADAVRARLDAEAVMHDGYIAAYDNYLKHAEDDSEWAEKNPFYYKVYRDGKDFQVVTNGEEKQWDGVRVFSSSHT